VYRKIRLCHFDHRYNVSPIHLHTLLGVENFSKVIRVCAERLKVVRDCPEFENHWVRVGGVSISELQNAHCTDTDMSQCVPGILLPSFGIL
jgi:hypothetical protein